MAGARLAETDEPRRNHTASSQVLRFPVLRGEGSTDFFVRFVRFDEKRIGFFDTRRVIAVRSAREERDINKTIITIITTREKTIIRRYGRGKKKKKRRCRGGKSVYRGTRVRAGDARESRSSSSSVVVINGRRRVTHV